MTATAVAAPVHARDIVQLPVRRVHPDPRNPRRDLGDLDSLTRSILRTGLLEPVVVRPHPELEGEWMLVAGHRRHAAHVKAAMSMIEATVRDELADEADALAAMLVENLQREDIHPLDEAAAYVELKKLGWKQKTIAEQTGRSSSVISKRLKLLSLPDEIAAVIRSGELPIESAYELARLARDDRSTVSIENIVKDLAEPDIDRAHYVDELRFDIIEYETDRLARADRLEKAAKAYAAEHGHRRLDDPAPAGAMKIEGWDALDVDYDEHLTEPCSRFLMLSSWDETYTPQFWCVEPARHAPDGESKVKAADEAMKRAERDKAAEADRRERERRRQIDEQLVRDRSLFLRETLIDARSMDSTDLFQTMARFAIATIDSTDARRSLELLDHVYMDGWDGHGPNVVELVRLFDQKPVDTTAAVLAAMLENRSLRHQRHSQTIRDEMLTGLGFEPAAPEQIELVEGE